MYKNFTAIFIVLLLVIQSFVSINQASAAEGLSINATVGGQQLLEIENGHSVTSNVIFDLLPRGTASLNERNSMDVVIVFDKSGSMADPVSRNNTKLSLAQDAVEEGVEIFFDSKKDFDDRYGIVAFDTYVNNVSTINGLHSNPNIVANKARQTSAEGGTNYTDALKAAKDMLIHAKDNGKYSGQRDQYIIFMTDGKPTNSSKYGNVHGYYHQLIQHNDYERIYGYSKYKDKMLDGKFVFYNDDWYVISDNRNFLSGNYNLLYDSNSKINSIVIDSQYGPYLYSHNNPSVPDKIKEHGREQARILADNEITMLSIGFGDQNQLDMSYLSELSAMSNGKAVRASSNDIIEIFKDISASISAEYPSLSNGFIRFNLPEGVTVQENDSVSVTDNEVIMSLRDILYNPNPPSEGDSSLHYELPLTFRSAGIYNFSFDVLYNSGKVSKTGIPYQVEVRIHLKSIEFSPKEKTIYIGERFKVEDYLRFNPSDATNKLIKNVSTNNNAPIVITKVGNEWYVTARDIGYATIEATADEDSTIKDSMRVIVSTRNTDSNNGGDNGDDDQDQDDGSDDDTDSGGGGNDDSELKW